MAFIGIVCCDDMDSAECSHCTQHRADRELSLVSLQEQQVLLPSEPFSSFLRFLRPYCLKTWDESRMVVHVCRIEEVEAGGWQVRMAT